MGNKKKSMSLNKTVWPSTTSPPLPRHLAKVGRNDPCPCGSGTKYKDCHLSEGEAFLKKIADEAEKERLRRLRAEMKEKGVPWYKRLFLRP